MRWAVRLLFVYCIVWALLKVPALVVAPQIEGVWLGFGELAVLLAGAWVLFARLGGVGEEGVWRFVSGDNGLYAARILFGVFLIPIGLSHLMYVKETVALVPEWLPYRVGWTYLTGAGRRRAAWRAVRRAAAGGCSVRGGNDQHLWAARVAAESGGRAEGAAAVDGVLDHLGDCRGCLGDGGEYEGWQTSFGFWKLLLRAE